VKLLAKLESEEASLQYIGRLLRSFSYNSALDEAGDLHLEKKVGALSPAKDHFMFETLTARELDVLNLMAERLINREIAARLFISAGTVKRHTENIYAKLGVHGRREAVAKAQGLGII
jgi:LuxR family maltose regulon positive regulatory protein